MKRMMCLALAIAAIGAAQATDIRNEDGQSYTVKVQGEGNLSISEHEVGAGGSVYGVCGYSFCSFEIPGDKIDANRDDRLTIRNGKFVKN
ncbi:MAG: hypothetical protein JNM27_16140 [Leptospirales bacterium]|nr:hypothetical protein [Leptospirales bacterium]